MALKTVRQSTTYIIGTDTVPVTLTTAYSGNQISFPVPGYDYAVIYASYVPGANGNTCSIQVEGSPDDTNYYPKTTLLDSDTGTSTLLDHIGQIPGASTAVTYKKRWIIPIDDRYVRISAKEDNAAGGTLTIQMLIRIK